MSAIANIVAFDGASTPVAHTFVPQSVVKNDDGTVVASYKENSLTVPDAAQAKVFITLKILSSGVYQATIRTEVPVMEAIAGNNSSGYTAAPKVAYVVTEESKGYYSNRSTVSDRRLVRQLHSNILNGLATTQTVVTTGPVAELIDSLIVPN